MVDDEFRLARRQGQALCRTVPAAKGGLGNFLAEFNPGRPAPDHPFTRVDDLVAVSPAVVLFLGLLDDAHANAQEALAAVVIP